MLNTLYKASKRVFLLSYRKVTFKNNFFNIKQLSFILCFGRKKKKEKSQQNLPCQQQKQSTTVVQRGNTRLTCKKTV